MKTIKVKGMSCQHCAKAVIKALSEIEAVTNPSVDLDKGEAYFDEVEPVSPEVIKQRIKQAGYEVD